MSLWKAARCSCRFLLAYVLLAIFLVLLVREGSVLFGNDDWRKGGIPRPARLALDNNPGVGRRNLEMTPPKKVDEAAEIQEVLNSVNIPRILSASDEEKAEQRRQHFRDIAKSSMQQQPSPPVLPSLFNYSSLTSKGSGRQSNPVNFAFAVASERLQRELSLGEDLDDQKEITSFADAKENNNNNNSLEQHPLFTAAAPRTVLIASTWRSGSSFLGDLIAHYPGTFYSFEPLHYLNRLLPVQTRKGLPAPPTALQLLQNLYRCDIDTQEMRGYLRHASHFDFLFTKHNHRLAKVCRNLLPNSAACFIPRLVEKVCKIFPVRLIKTVRLRVSESEELLRSMPDLRVIVLFRDPRGMMASRASMEWCTQDSCSDTKTVCALMEKDVKAAADLSRRYAGRVKIVRYEDLGLRTGEVAQDILEFLELPDNNHSVQRFVDSHTNGLKKQTNGSDDNAVVDPYGTYRDSATATFAWRDKLDGKNLDKIQKLCHWPMNALGYKLLESIEQVKDKEIPVMSEELQLG